MARLSSRATEFAEFEARLAQEEITAEALNGRLRVVMTGDGRPVSLHIDPAALHGPKAAAWERTFPNSSWPPASRRTYAGKNWSPANSRPWPSPTRRAGEHDHRTGRQVRA
ncbi:YbaB/EbfC family nucleoid-associated protein [Actinomadura sp. J1-007]|uniref:YbaB/EbfC family nucleoid-associated protein n=1 Tax=Actinomadura sp. J1-007 TaxID=2661913 RepID=UPI00136ACDD9